MNLRMRRDLRTVVRYLPLALVPLLLCASTFPGHFRVSWVYWLLAMSAAVLFAAADRWPVPMSLGLSVLAIPLFRMQAWGLSGLVPYLGAVGLVAAVARTRGRGPVAVAGAGWAAAVVLGRWHSHDVSWPQMGTIVEVGTYVGVFVLLGLYLRGQRDLAAGLRARAADAEARRVDAELRTRTQERAAMARELHDLIAHHMASIVLRIGVVRHVVRTDPRVGEVLDDVHDTAADALADIRRLLDALRDPALGEVALIEPAAMRSEIEAAAQRVRSAGFTVTADIVPDLDGLDAIGRLTLMRLVQESLTNVMKHANPALPVELVIRHSDGGVAVRIHSGGGTPGPPGHGIVGMRERVELAGGWIAVGPVERGWEVGVWLPGERGSVARQWVSEEIAQ